ncbi:SRPBCC domain-containing protein [Salinibacterium sp. G-O1]|uniref:SRPBCC family protein n=1 Tax=Salinibacterium sp. G-O1 TaxID=3046208 RepID=UPI0024B8D2C4|nr:SRPBCC domain-containing protein [Salinibacterium sp. G-O1]MDJ0335912.1 SRPBCC domain-containing protein [Salinibacterium sp. G-O1]
MPIITSDKNVEALTLTFTSHFDAAVERVWQVWEDPRQLERWWGPPDYPATFQQHDFVEGGKSLYFMTSPEGQKMWGWWTVTATDAPSHLEFDDGFADPDGSPNDQIPPTHMSVTLEPFDGGTRMTAVTQFASEDQLNQMIDMGIEEGMIMAQGQIEAILAE